MERKKRSKPIIGWAIIVVVLLILGLGVNYIFCPAWNLRSPGMWAFFITISVIASFITLITYYCSDDDTYKVPAFIAIGVLCLSIVFLLFGALFSSPLMHASGYHNIVEINEASFEEDIPTTTDDMQVLLVDVGTARRLGDRTIGGIKNVSWYEVDNEYNLIQYQGEYYRISELNYGGLFKYFKAKSFGIPGYVLVNASTQEAKYVELENPIRYSPSAFFGFDLKRHLRHQYPGYIFGTHFFEIDEEGNSYYITSVKKPSIGYFGGKKEESFIITDTYTGESQEYTVDDLPDWVDHAFDLEYLMKVTYYNQRYINGFWNSLFGKTGVNNISYNYRDKDFAGYNTAITSNGDIVFFTGVTPASVAESNIGFILASPRTGEINYYECSGAEESSAQVAAQSLVQNFGYTATFPTLLNVDGYETYFMLLKDSAGLVQRYSLCSVKDYTKVVQAESFEEALRLYIEKLGVAISTVAETESQELYTTDGFIKELSQAEIDGCTFYFFTLDDDNGKLYMSSIKNNYNQVFLKLRTDVTLIYTNSSEEGVFIVQKIQF